MSKPISNTYMQVDYPRGETTIGCVFETNAGQRIRMLGAIYGVKDLLESGYTFTPLIALTPQVVQALKMVLYGEPTFGDIKTVRQLLAQDAQGGDDATQME